MRVCVVIEGNQIHETHIGEVLAYGQTVEYFNQQPMQVPCITIDTGAQILTISLKTDMTRSRVTKLLETVHT